MFVVDTSYTFPCEHYFTCGQGLEGGNVQRRKERDDAKKPEQLADRHGGAFSQSDREDVGGKNRR